MHGHLAERSSTAHLAELLHPGADGAPLVSPGRSKHEELPARRRHLLGIEALVQAGLSHEAAHAEMARLRAGDIWSG